MERRWLVALALVAGCGGGGRGAGTDAATDVSTDASDAARDVAATADTRPDAATDVRGDGTGTAGAGGLDAKDAKPSADHPVDTALQTYCPTQIPTVTVDSGPVNGVLKGPSYNPAVSCHGGVATQGPEAYFTLTLDAPLTLDVVVAAPVDTLIAIRSGACMDGISEIVCGEEPPNSDVDGGIAVPAGIDAGTGTRLTGVRALLAAGTYTIVVDTYSLGTLPSASFTMALSRVQPRPNAACSAPTLLAAGTTVSAEPLDLAGAAMAVCGSGATQSSLYYTVGVPAGQRLTARATPRGGDHSWMPRINAFTSCTSNTCLAQGHLASGTTQQLDWINNGASWQLVYLAVGADGPVSGATFDLSVSIIDLLATCTRPVPVKDGTTLLNQDLSVAASSLGQTCLGSVDHAFYYAATLLPQQTISVSAVASPGANNFSIPTVSIRQSCDGLQCSGAGEGANFVNQTSSDATVIIEVAPQQQGFAGLFDLTVSIPPPPANIFVTPTSGLVTSESGATATFTVALGSPPTADVTIAVASDTPTEGTASPATLRFTSDNWRTPQTVTVKGVDDQVGDGPRDYTIVTSAAQSTDSNYTGLDAEDVEVTNLDNDPGLTVVGASDLSTSEAGTTSSFLVSLNSAPTANVTMALTSNDVGEGTVSPALLTFTAANWNVPQTVTVKGVDDAMADGTQTYTIVTGPFASTDTRYNGQNPVDLTARNRDDDQVAVSAKLISGDHNCSSTSSGPYPIALDRAGKLYIVMTCDNALWLTTSSDGGVTFAEPTLIPGTEIPVGFVQLAAGAPGFAYLLFSTSDGSIDFVRTADGGSTWGAVIPISTQTNIAALAAAEKTVLVLTSAPDGANSMVLSRSLDGGRSFPSRTTVDDANLDVALEADAQTAWLLQLDGPEALFKSTNAGATFTKIGELSLDVSSHVIGKSSLFTQSGDVEITSLADPTMSTPSVGFINGPPFSLTVDDADDLTILDNDPDSHLRATHIVAGGTLPTEGRSLGPAPAVAGAVALSRKASAIAFVNGSLVLYTTVVW